MSSQDNDLPKGVRLTSLDPAFKANPYPRLKVLRERAPVLNDTEFNRWFVTQFDEVRALLRDKRVSVDPRKTQPGSYAARMMRAQAPQDSSAILTSVMFVDDPEHHRLRSLVNKPFSPKAVESLRPQVREIARTLLEGIQEREFDLMESFGAPFTAGVTAEMLGVDPADRQAFKGWADMIVATFYNPFRTAKKTAETAESQRQLDTYFQKMIELRRESPGPDFISTMLRAEDESGDRLSDHEIIIQCSLLILAGQVTTLHTLGNGIKALLEHPQELAKLRARPELITNAVEEILRYDVPTLNSYRIVQNDMTVGGCPFHAGDVVTVSLAGANHDPAVNPDPERFDIERENIQHQAFGGGKHVCLGAPLARVALQEAISALLARFPNLRPSSRGFRLSTVTGLRGMSEYWLET